MEGKHVEGAMATSLLRPKCGMTKMIFCFQTFAANSFRSAAVSDLLSPDLIQELGHLISSFLISLFPRNHSCSTASAPNPHCRTAPKTRTKSGRNSQQFSVLANGRSTISGTAINSCLEYCLWMSADPLQSLVSGRGAAQWLPDVLKISYAHNVSTARNATERWAHRP